MPRQSRGRSSAAPRSVPAQNRGAHTATAPTGYAPSRAPAPSASVPATQNKSAAESGQPGMLAQMAATAGSVAVGSTVGHALSSMLFGGGSSTAPETQAPPPPVQQMARQQTGGISCEIQAKDFTLCLENADIESCRWYLDQLKACQAAAAPY